MKQNQKYQTRLWLILCVVLFIVIAASAAIIYKNFNSARNLSANVAGLKSTAKWTSYKKTTSDIEVTFTTPISNENFLQGQNNKISWTSNKPMPATAQITLLLVSSQFDILGTPVNGNVDCTQVQNILPATSTSFSWQARNICTLHYHWGIQPPGNYYIGLTLYDNSNILARATSPLFNIINTDKRTPAVQNVGPTNDTFSFNDPILVSWRLLNIPNTAQVTLNLADIKGEIIGTLTNSTDCKNGGDQIIATADSYTWKNHRVCRNWLVNTISPGNYRIVVQVYYNNNMIASGQSYLPFTISK